MAVWSPWFNKKYQRSKNKLNTKNDKFNVEYIPIPSPKSNQVQSSYYDTSILGNLSFKRISHDILYGVRFVYMESKYVTFYILP